MGGAGMDDISRGIATAAIALQSAMLQALVKKGVFTLEEALEVVDKGLRCLRSRRRGCRCRGGGLGRPDLSRRGARGLGRDGRLSAF